LKYRQTSPEIIILLKFNFIDDGSISNFVPPANFDFNVRKGDNVALCFWNLMSIMANMADNITFGTKTPGIIQ